LVAQEVGEGAEHRQSAGFPGILEQLATARRGYAEEGAGRPRAHTAVRAVAGHLTNAGVVALDLRDVVGIELLVAHRHGEARRALEHEQLTRLLTHLLHDLDAARSRANHAHALAGEADGMMRPFAGAQQ